MPRLRDPYVSVNRKDNKKASITCNGEDALVHSKRKTKTPLSPFVCLPYNKASNRSSTPLSPNTPLL
jgi:hypothetical protein